MSIHDNFLKDTAKSKKKVYGDIEWQITLK